MQRAKLGFLREQDLAAAATRGGSGEIEAAVRNYEIAAQMQTLVPELCDVSRETAATLELYGVDRANDYERFYALQCLRARRMVEAGVRFIEVTCPLTHTNNAPWDQHGELKLRHEENARITDQPVAALIADLKARGLLGRHAGRCGPAKWDARRIRPAPTAATITSAATPFGWLAAACGAAPLTARPTRWA